MTGDGEWSCLWRNDTGEVIIGGDHYLIEEAIAAISGVNEIVLNDSDWVPDDHTPLSLQEAILRKEDRENRQANAKELRLQADDLLRRANALEQL